MESKEEQANVWVHDDQNRILFYREVPKPTKQSLTDNFKRVAKLAKDYEEFSLLIDLSNAERPSAEIRQHVSEKLGLFREKINHLAIYTGKNFILNMAVTFTFRKVNLESYSIHKTLEEAEKAIEEIRK